MSSPLPRGVTPPPDIKTVDELMAWLREQGYSVPRADSFPAGSTARELFEKAITFEDDPEFKIYARVDGTWAPLREMPGQRIDVWVAKDGGGSGARSAVARWLRRVAAALTFWT